MAQLFLNNLETSFIAPVQSVALTGTPATELGYGILQISDGAAGALINPTGGDYYVLTAFKRAGTVESNVEVMRVTAVDNATPGECRITVSRAQEGTTAQSYVSGDRLALRLTAAATNNWVQTDDPRMSNSRAPNGTAGGVLSGSFPNPVFAEDMATQAELNAVSAAMVTASSTTTLTNKTLTGYTETVYNLVGTDISPANGTIQYKTLAANTTFTESLADGQSVVLMLNPSTFTTTWPTATWIGSAASTPPTLIASVYNCITLFKFGGTLYGKYEGRV